MTRKFPFYKQHDAMQCGVACLRMVCAHWGRKYTMDELERVCHASRDGISMLGLSEAAGDLGLKPLCGKLTLAQLEEIELPAILYWNQNHFVVLYKTRRGRKSAVTYYIADPGKGLLRRDAREMDRAWLTVRSHGEDKGIAMLMEPTPSFYTHQMERPAYTYDLPEPERPRPLGFLWSYFRRYKHYFGQVLLGLALTSGLQLAFPFLTQAIVDTGIRDRDISLIWLILLGQLTLIVSQTAIDFTQRWILLHIGIRVNISLVSDFFIKLLKLPMSFFDTKLTGDLLQRMGDHKRVEEFLTTESLTVLFSLITFLILSVVLLVYDPLIFAVFLGGSLLYAGWIALFLGKRRELDYDLFERQAENNNATYQFLTSMQEIKLQDCGQRRRWHWEDVQASLYQIQTRALKLTQAQEAGGLFLTQAKNILITVLAATAVINGQMSLGMMLAVQYIIGQLNGPVERLMRFIYAVQDVKISLDRINEIHQEKNEESDPRTLARFPEGESRDLSFHDVCFSYDPHDPRKTIDHVSFTIPRGKITAIVGMSGSGKTTLLKLLLGYYRPQSGDIRIGDTPLYRFNMRWWRRQCGVVMQDGVIFSESIIRNIAVDDNEEIDFNRMKWAVQVANIEDFILSLPLKYDTVIGPDGVGLSMGQKQRILIARAVYKEPEFVFLDEATNSLDANNEHHIEKFMIDFFYKKTVLLIAHRLSTVRFSDQIIVVDQGKIVEVGTHDELWAKHGYYHRLVVNQTQYIDEPFC